MVQKGTFYYYLLDEQPKQHYVAASSFQVTWWPGDKAEQDIQSLSTLEDQVTIAGLQPGLAYTVVVEARHMQKYAPSDGERISLSDSFCYFISLKNLCL